MRPAINPLVPGIVLLGVASLSAQSTEAADPIGVLGRAGAPAEELRAALRSVAAMDRDQVGDLASGTLTDLAALAEHPDAGVRAEWMGVVAKLGARSIELGVTLRAALVADDPAVRADAALAWSLMQAVCRQEGVVDADAILNDLFSGDARRCARGVEALQGAGVAAGPLLVRVAQRVDESRPAPGLTDAFVALRDRVGPARSVLRANLRSGANPKRSLKILLALEDDEDGRRRQLVEAFCDRLSHDVRRQLVELGAGPNEAAALVARFAHLGSSAKHGLLGDLPRMDPEWERVWPRLGPWVGAEGFVPMFARLLVAMGGDAVLAVPDLRRALGTGMTSVRVDWLRALQRMPMVTAHLADEIAGLAGNAATEVAVEALHVLAAREAVADSTLERALAAGAAHAVPAVRVAALHAGLRLGAARALAKPLLELLADGDRSVSAWAHWGMPFVVHDGQGHLRPQESLGAAGKGLLERWNASGRQWRPEKLVAAAGAQDDREAALALDVMARLDRLPEGALEVCRRTLAAPSGGVRLVPAIRVLRRMGAAAIPALPQLASAPCRTSGEWREVCAAMAGCGEAGARALRRMISVPMGSEPFAALAALEALSVMGPAAEPAKARVVELASQPRSPLHEAARRCLIALDATAPADDEVWEPDLDPIRRLAPGSRTAAVAETLAHERLGRSSELELLRLATSCGTTEPLVEQLAARLASGDEEIQQAAVNALAGGNVFEALAAASMHGRRAPGPLRDVWRNGAPRARRLAGFLLRVTAALPTPPPPWFRRFLDDPLPTVRRLAIEQVARGAEPRDLPVVVDALDDLDAGVRRAACLHLRSLGSDALPALERLRPLIADRLVGGLALEVVVAIGSPGHTVLREAIADPTLCVRAAHAIRAMDPLPRSLADALLAAFESPVGVDADARVLRSHYRRLDQVGMVLARFDWATDPELEGAAIEVFERVVAFAPFGAGHAAALASFGELGGFAADYLAGGLEAPSLSLREASLRGLLAVGAHDRAGAFAARAAEERDLASLAVVLQALPAAWWPSPLALIEILESVAQGEPTERMRDSERAVVCQALAAALERTPLAVRRELAERVLALALRWNDHGLAAALGAAASEILERRIVAAGEACDRWDLEQLACADPARMLVIGWQRGLSEAEVLGMVADAVAISPLEIEGRIAGALVHVPERLVEARVDEQRAASRCVRSLLRCGESGQRAIAQWMVRLHEADVARVRRMVLEVATHLRAAPALSPKLFEVLAGLAADHPKWGYPMLAVVFAAAGPRGVALLEANSNHIPLLEGVLEYASAHGGERGRIAALRALGRMQMGDPARLNSALCSESATPEVRRWAALTMIERGATGEILEQAAVVAFDAEDPIFARRALEAMLRGDAVGASVRPLLVELLAADDAENRQLAERLLERLDRGK